MSETIQRVVLTAINSSLEQTLPILVPLLGFGWLIHLFSSLLEKSAVKLFGLKAHLYLLGWLGTLVHELGHAVFCPLFGHRVTGMRLFSLSTRRQNAGYVCHSYNGWNPYHLIGNFFISIGPLVLGSFLIYLSLRYLAGLPLHLDAAPAPGKSSALTDGMLVWSGQFLRSLKIILVQMGRNLDPGDYRLYLAGYLVLSIGSAMTLSRQDLHSAGRGLGVVLLLVFAINLILAGIGLSSPDVAPLVRWAAVTCMMLMVILILCGTAALLLGLLSRLTGR
ncbi:MAG TPA: M50 family metallopeptidase [archaeon]|nr:M50 family metallopeptidase [archaeon]